MSPQLQQFYKEIQQWISSGCPTHPRFVKHHGLCLNLWWWSSKSDTLDMELTQQFQQAGLNPILPFNRCFDNASLPSYEEEVVQETIFQNEKRLAWVTQHANA